MDTKKRRVLFCACIIFAGVENSGWSTNRVAEVTDKE